MQSLDDNDINYIGDKIRIGMKLIINIYLYWEREDKRISINSRQSSTNVEYDPAATLVEEI